MKLEDTTTGPEEEIATEKDRKRFLERYCDDDFENNLSLEFVTLEAVAKAQNEMLKVQDLHSDLVTYTKGIVTTTINTLKEEITIVISKGAIVFQKNDRI